MELLQTALKNFKYSQVKREVNRADYKTAKQLVDDDVVTSEVEKVTIEDNIIIISINASCMHPYTLGMSFEVEYDLNKDSYSFVDTYCECFNQAGYICEHQVAALMKCVYDEEVFEKYMQSLEKKQKFVPTSSHIMEALNGIIDTNIAPYIGTNYRLNPIIEIEEGITYLKLRVEIIGEKSYPIKDIYKLVTYFENDMSISYDDDYLIKYNIVNFENQGFVRYVLDMLANSSKLIDEVMSSPFPSLKMKASQVKYEKKRIELRDEQVAEITNYFTQIQVKFEDERQIAYQIRNTTDLIPFSLEKSKASFIFNTKMPVANSYASSNCLVFINFVEPTIFKIEIEGELLAKVLASLLVNDNIVSEQDIESFKFSIYKRIERYIDCNFVIEEESNSQIITKLSLDGEILHVQSYADGDSFNREQLRLAATPYFAPIVKQVKGSDGSNYQYLVDGIPNIIEFTKHYLKVIEANSDVVRANEKYAKFKVVEKVDMKINIQVKATESILKFDSSQYDEKELITVLQALERQQEYISVVEGEYIDLSSSDMEYIKRACDKAGISIEESLGNEQPILTANAFYIEQVFSESDVEVSLDSTLEDMLENMKNPRDYCDDYKGNINVDLREYQKIGINWLHMLEDSNLGGILADDMGLGKTLQVIGLLSSSNSENPNIIITPAALVYNWKHEILKFSNNIKPIVIDGVAKVRHSLISQIENGETYITSYDLYKRDIKFYEEIYFNQTIIDEAQAIKNPSALVTKSVKQINSMHRIALTGTPIENNLLELWSIFDFVMPCYLGTNKEFQRRYLRPIGDGDKARSEELQKRIKPFILRRLKADVLPQLPEKLEKTVYVQMGVSQQKLYDSQVLKIQKFLGKDDSTFNTEHIQLLAMITKLRQIACNPHLIDEKYTGTVAKLEYLKSVITSLVENKHKVVIFSQFVSNFEYIEQVLNELGYDYYKITGQTEKQKRHRLVENFNRKSVPVFLISLKAGGTGLNITGADTVIHYDPWWNVAAQSQATDRVHRMGQKQNVLVYKLICEGSIEERILKLQNDKAKLIDTMIDGNQFDIKKMSKDDFISLFS